MRMTSLKLLGVAPLVLLAACATRPVGPTVRVLPAAYKPFDVFQRDVDDCRSFADQQVAGQVNAANNRGVGAAVVGTALGAALGAAAGGGRGAGVGAAFGAAAGTTVGANESEREGYGIQRRYDNAYAECMYSKGNQVPGYGGPGGPPPPRRGAPPPPPRGYNY
jgi:uncharacterized protein YcfJ